MCVFESISVVIPIRREKKWKNVFPIWKREKKNVHITFNLWRSFPLLLEILDLLRERVCMVCVNIVGYRKNKQTKKQLFCMVQVCLKFCFVHIIKSIK